MPHVQHFVWYPQPCLQQSVEHISALHKFRCLPNQNTAMDQRYHFAHQTRLINCSRTGTENEKQKMTVKHTHTIDGESADTSFHPKPAGGNPRSFAKQMGQDGYEVGQADQYDETADESIERDGRANIHAAEKGVDHGAPNNSNERILAWDGCDVRNLRTGSHCRSRLSIGILDSWQGLFLPCRKGKAGMHNQSTNSVGSWIDGLLRYWGLGKQVCALLYAGKIRNAVEHCD